MPGRGLHVWAPTAQHPHRTPPTGGEHSPPKQGAGLGRLHRRLQSSDSMALNTGSVRRWPPIPQGEPNQPTTTHCFGWGRHRPEPQAFCCRESNAPPPPRPRPRSRSWGGGGLGSETQSAQALGRFPKDWAPGGRCRPVIDAEGVRRHVLLVAAPSPPPPRHFLTGRHDERDHRGCVICDMLGTPPPRGPAPPPPPPHTRDGRPPE